MNFLTNNRIEFETDSPTVAALFWTRGDSCASVFFRLAELVHWQPLAILLHETRKSSSSKASHVFVRLQERDIFCKPPQRCENQCSCLERSISYKSRTCETCCSSRVRDSRKQSISDLLPESQGCLDAGWVEFLLDATN